MFVNPENLIDQTLKNLQLISELLDDDLDRLTHPFVSPDTVKASNTVRTIQTLMPQFKTAKEKLRSACAVKDLPGLSSQRVCANCND